ncbi:MAG TPA: antibiotic biosynthesis monooxygenase [Dongiaceae bacterium]|nr:antibiotic biosynthesis monooxygenase [Dongiaceae bacterium]
MFVTLWEFEVKRGSEELFEYAYGAQGAWVRLFQRDPAYRGTRLLRDVAAQGLYLTLDSWDSRQAYEAFKNAHSAEYAAIDHECEALSERERHLGAWS